MSFMLWVITVVVVLMSKFWYRWSNPKATGKLPPGSMGFPIIGETMAFFESHELCEILPFVKKRMLRYGPLFRTNIFGANTVVSTDKDVIMYVLREENKSFVASYANTVGKALGDNNLLEQHGEMYKQIKQISSGFFSSEGLKRRMVGDLDRMTQEHFRSKASSQEIFEVDKAAKNLVLEYLTPKMISNLKPENETKLIDGFNDFGMDWFTPYLNISKLRALFKALKGRRGAIRVINDALTQRKASREKHTDFLDMLLTDLEKDGSLLTQKSAENLIFFVLSAATESTSKVTVLILKFLLENPKVLAELKREHEAILERREEKECGVTWEEFRNKMSFTGMVISEVLRLTNSAPTLFRKAVKDVEITGYTIPAGWTVMVVPMVVHFDPQVYENPLEFNPWRWEGKDVRLGSKTFMAFGGGMRQCIGAEFARLQLSIYIHYLVTRYEISVVQDCEVLRLPALSLKKAMRIKLNTISSS